MEGWGERLGMRVGGEEDWRRVVNLLKGTVEDCGVGGGGGVEGRGGERKEEDIKDVRDDSRDDSIDDSIGDSIDDSIGDSNSLSSSEVEEEDERKVEVGVKG